jgi:hypothetical protein
LRRLPPAFASYLALQHPPGQAFALHWLLGSLKKIYNIKLADVSAQRGKAKCIEKGGSYTGVISPCQYAINLKHTPNLPACKLDALHSCM